MIIRDGIISYYRDQPHALNFIKSLSKNYGKPKGQVPAKVCEFKRINPNIFIRKKYPYLFEISFLSISKIYKRIFWVFAVNNEEQIGKWIRMLEEAKQIGLSANEEEIDAQRKHEEEMAKLLRQKQLKEEAQKRAADLERRRNKQKEKIIEEDKKKNEIENEIRRLQLEAEEKRKAELNEKREEWNIKIC